MPHRRALLACLAWPCLARAAEPEGGRYSSEAIRRRAEEQARRREEFWARERERQADERFRREQARRRGDTGRMIERWEEQRERRLYGRPSPW
jgi:hypothetical protein